MNHPDCFGKVSHPTRHQAEKVAKHGVRYGRHKKKLKAYQCPACRNWHLGSAK